MRKLILWGWMWGCVGVIGAQQLAPNGTFEEGTTTPAAWNLDQGQGEWLAEGGVSNSHCLSVSGAGEDSNAWHSAPLQFKPQAVYRLSFMLRGNNAHHGTVVSGTEFANIDCGVPDNAWRYHENFFMVPSAKEPIATPLRLGQWHLTGMALFDNLSLTQVTPIFRRAAGVELGAGEQIDANQYSFNAPLSSLWRNHSRVLVHHTARFNTDRWAFGEHAVVVYRHQIADRQLLNSKVRLGCSYWVSGSLVVEAANDTQKWHPLGVITNVGSATFDLPEELFPANEIRIRLRATKETSLQINDYALEATLDGTPLTLRGKTSYVEVAKQVPPWRVQVLDLGDDFHDDAHAVKIGVRKIPRPPVATQASVVFTQPLATPVTNQVEFTLGEPGNYELEIPYALPGVGTWEMQVQLGNFFEARSTLRVNPYFRHDYGELLTTTHPQLNLWRASSGWKIPRQRALPQTVARGLTLRLARNEREALQLVLRPNQDLTNVLVRVEEMQYGNHKLPLEGIDVWRVGYVPIQTPSDATGVAADWPDPLLPQVAPRVLSADQNHAYWIRVQAPGGCAAGIYRGTVKVQADGIDLTVPMSVEVYDFELPEVLSCETALGFNPHTVWRYHGVSDVAQKHALLEQYFTIFKESRISVYNPTPLDNWHVEWLNVESQDPQKIEPKFDWSAWDAAMEEALQRYHFATVRLNVSGLGGGTFHSRSEPEILGYSADSPAYDILMGKYLSEIEKHLDTKGWLDKVYIYWFDEPEPKDYDFVMRGFATLKKHAPRLRRMLTEQVEEALVGGPNLWCPVLHLFDQPGNAARRAAGDQFWWYICCVPKAPYVTEFIDHPATELRVWLWQTWAAKVSGILIWDTVYWHSNIAYPDGGGRQNPYLDPMSWVSGYGVASGTKNPWGNGDGRLVYPPLAAATGAPSAPVLEAPVVSLRLEMLRDGLEDYEYFVLLNTLLQKHGAKLALRERTALEGLLQVPKAVSASLTNFTDDPAPLEEHRDKLARAIVRMLRFDTAQ